MAVRRWGWAADPCVGVWAYVVWISHWLERSAQIFYQQKERRAEWSLKVVSKCQNIESHSLLQCSVQTANWWAHRYIFHISLFPKCLQIWGTAHHSGAFSCAIWWFMLFQVTATKTSRFTVPVPLESYCLCWVSCLCMSDSGPAPSLCPSLTLHLSKRSSSPLFHKVFLKPFKSLLISICSFISKSQKQMMVIIVCLLIYTNTYWVSGICQTLF